MRVLLATLALACAPRALPLIDAPPPLPADRTTGESQGTVRVTTWHDLRLSGTRRQSLETVLAWLEATPAGVQRTLVVSAGGLAAVQHTPVDRLGAELEALQVPSEPFRGTWERWRQTGRLPEAAVSLETVPDEVLLIETARRRLESLARRAAAEGREVSVTARSDDTLVWTMTGPDAQAMEVQFAVSDRSMEVTARVAVTPAPEEPLPDMSPWSCSVGTDHILCALQTRWDPRKSPGPMAGLGLLRAVEVLDTLVE